MAYEFNHYYELQNVATGKYVNVLGNHEDGTVKNGETVNLFSRTNNPDQRWALENFGGNGNVRIVLQRGEGWYALNYNTRNTNCIVWHLNTADDTDTVITTVEVENRPNTYYLMLRDRSIYLTAVGTALKWSAYTGEEEQMSVILSAARKNANGQPPNGRGNRPIGGCLPWSCAGAVHSVPPDGGSPRTDGRPVVVPDLSGVAQRRQNYPEVQAIRQRRSVRCWLLLGGHRLPRRYGVTADYRKTAVPDTRPGQRL